MSYSNNPCFLEIDKHFGTKVTHVGQNPDQWTFKDVIPPISLSTTFKQHGPNNHAVSFFKFEKNNNLNSLSLVFFKLKFV